MTTSTNAINVLNDVIAVNLNFSIWTGRKMLEENDLALNGKIPPSELVSLGSKHTTDPAALKPFHKLKRRAERACMRYGIPFLGGYAIPRPRAEELAKDLSKIVADFDKERTSYLADHESTQAKWIEAYPEYENILTKALTPVEYVEKRIVASYSMFQIKSAEAAIGFDAGLSNQLDSLGDTLDDDILKSAIKQLASLSSAIAPNRTNVNSLSSLREKIDGLAFLDNRFVNLSNEIKKVEISMPVAGKLNANEVSLLSGLLYRMSDPVKLDALMRNIDDDYRQANAVTEDEAKEEDVNSFADPLGADFDVDSFYGIDDDIDNDIANDIIETGDSSADFEWVDDDFSSDFLNDIATKEDESMYF